MRNLSAGAPQNEERSFEATNETQLEIPLKP
jgi:hypothetical protein